MHPSSSSRLAHAHTHGLRLYTEADAGREHLAALSPAVAFSWQIDKLGAVWLGVKIMDSNKLRLFIGLVQLTEVRCRLE